MTHPSATTTMRRELGKIGSAMAECVTEEGHVKTSHRYRYQILIDEANSFRKSIAWLEAQCGQPSADSTRAPGQHNAPAVSQ